MSNGQRMLIVADENLPYVSEAFGTLGETLAVPTNKITPDVVADADILVVRYATTVDENLLTGSSVRFVATASSGTDHVDVEYLRSRGIGFANAPGSNSNSVAEYIITSLLLLHRRRKISLAKIQLGVVGVGNVGSKVVRMAQDLGIRVLQNDPPRARLSKASEFLPLDELMGCDVITLHVPLSRRGTDATYHFFDKARLRKMRKGSILINTSRGEVVAESALREALQGGYLSASVIDVWENEPDIDTELLRLADIGTPHIAGYSWDGRANGTVMIHRAACEFFGISEKWKCQMSSAEPSHLEVDVEGRDWINVIDDIVSAIYDIEMDDSRLREVLELRNQEKASRFLRLRADYPRRREFFNTTLRLRGADSDVASKLRQLGFKVAGGTT